MSYRSPALARRSRRRRWLAATLLLLTAVLLLGLASRRRSEARDTVEYLSVVEEVTREAATATGALGEVLASIGTEERPLFLRRLDGLAETTAALRERLTEARAPTSLSEAHGYLSVAVGSWADAAAALREGATTTLDEPSDPRGQELLVRAFDLFRLGDVAYAAFLGNLAAGEAGSGRSLPPVVFLDAVDPEDNPTQVGLRLRAGYALGRHRDVSVTAVTDPEVAGERNGVPIIPAADTVKVSAVVVNEGNEATGAVTVTLRIVPVGGDPAESARSLDSLGPDEARTVDFDSITLPRDRLVELSVVVATEEDVDPSNDVWTLLVMQDGEG